jgi:hypothetical protein
MGSVEWTGARYADTPTVEASTWIDADPARVRSLVSDIKLMPTLSNELRALECRRRFHGRRRAAAPTRRPGRTPAGRR